MPRISQQSGSALRSALITIAIIAVALAFAATLLPRGFSDDVSRIGQGRGAIVLVHNKEAVLSLEMMTLMNRVRGDYEDRVEFLAVDEATDTGRRFAAAQGVNDSVLVLFAPDGARLAVLDSVRSEADMRAVMERYFSQR